MGTETRAWAPATVANLGPGFDVLGLALERPGATVRARRVPEAGALVPKDHPFGPVEQAALHAAQAVLDRTWTFNEVGVELSVEWEVPLGTGLGAAAAAAAAGAMATNLIVGSPLRKRELVGICLAAEDQATQLRHVDHVAAAILGGLVLVRSVDPLDIVRLPIPQELVVVVVTPDTVPQTQGTRKGLPPEVPLAAAVQNCANTAALVSACYAGDLVLLSRCLTDALVTPLRAPHLPGAEAAMEAARDSGALGSSLSGSGPAVFALCRSMRSAAEVSTAMVAAFAAAGVAVRATRSAADCPGVRRL